MTPAARRCAAPALVTVLLANAAVTLCGCNWTNPYGTSVSDIRATSLTDDPVSVTGDFTTAVYSDQLTSELSFYVSDLEADDLINGDMDNGQVLRIELLWEPKPGKTPLDSSATNIALRYVIFADGEVGLYEGGGFALTNRVSFTERITISMLDSSLRLSDSTPGFRDLLGPTRITGTFTASLDRHTTHRLHVLLSQRVTDALGHSTLVMRDVEY